MLTRGDVLYLPVGTVHSARSDGDAASLHATVSVDRTADARGRPMRGFDWASLLASLISAAEKASPPTLDVANGVQLLGWLSAVGAAEDLGGVTLRSVPRALHGACSGSGAWSGAAEFWHPNCLLHSLDGEWDLPCPEGGESTGAGKGAAGAGAAGGCLTRALQREYAARIEPLLRASLRPSAGAPTEVVSGGSSGEAGEGGAEARGAEVQLLGWLDRFRESVVGDAPSVSHALREARARMQDTMPSLAPRAGFALQLSQARDPAVARARAAAAHLTSATRLRRAWGVRPLLSGATLRANVPHEDWPQAVPACFLPAVGWSLGAFSGAMGRPFRVSRLFDDLGALGEAGESAPAACADTNTSAVEAVRWLVVRRALVVVG